MPVTITLNDYQAANLRWLLRVVWDCRQIEYPPLSTGDWVGEIPTILEQAMIEADITQKPNSHDKWAEKPLEGMYGGMKRADYEVAIRKTQLERVEKIAALKNTPDTDKLALIQDVAKGCWGIPHLRALERG